MFRVLLDEHVLASYKPEGPIKTCAVEELQSEGSGADASRTLVMFAEIHNFTWQKRCTLDNSPPLRRIWGLLYQMEDLLLPNPCLPQCHEHSSSEHPRKLHSIDGCLKICYYIARLRKVQRVATHEFKIENYE